jgi:hypothetical protein
MSVIKQRIFNGWSCVPKEYKTRAAWERDFRRVRQGDKSAATVTTSITRKLESTGGEGEYTIEKSYKLYHVSETRPVRRTPLNTAQHEFYEIFARWANRQKLIRWTRGEWRDDDGEKCWDSTSDAWGWRTYQEHLGLNDCIAHINGREIYGAFGGDTSCYLMIDVDLHNMSLKQFLMRLAALLDAFHGKHSCHFQVSNENAGGVHVILYFGKQSSLASRLRWITNELAKLDERYPGANFTKIEGGRRVLEIEVYPDLSNGHRLPLCRGRTMLLDGPLPLVTHGKRQSQDVAGYIEWLKDGSRKYMDEDDVYRFVVERLDLSSAAADGKETTPSKPSNRATQTAVSLKGKTRGALIGFWQRGETGHFRHLNAAVAVTLRALCFEGLEQDEAVELVSRYVDEIPNDDLSSRLAGDRKEIYRVIGSDARTIWSNNGGQSDSDGSSEKWRATMERWNQTGFRVSDKSTWVIREPTQVVVEEIEFTESERRLLVEEMAPVLVGVKQAQKEEKQQEVIRAVGYFLNYVKCHGGEISLTALPVILKSFKLNVFNHSKQQRFFDLLRAWDWIYLRADYYHPTKHGGTASRGRARAYGVGNAMAQKFSLLNSSPQQQRTYILSPIFWEDVEIPSYEEQLTGILTVEETQDGPETANLPVAQGVG